MDADALVRDYLGRLEAAASDLPAERRAELIGDVREHIGLALAEVGQVDEASVRVVIERIGAPDEIVAAETESPILMPVGATGTTLMTTRSRALSAEARALLLLTVGALVLPFVGPILGLWVGSASTCWTITQKRTAALIVLVLLAMPAGLILPAVARGEITWVFTTGGFSLPLVPLAGIAAAAYLIVSTSVVLTVSRRPWVP